MIKPKVVLTVRVRPQLKIRLRRRAARLGMRLSAMISRILEDIV